MRTITPPEHSEGAVARAIEQQTAKLPSDTFLWMAGGSIAASMTLKLMGRDKDALFVGLTEGFVGSIWLGYDRPSPMPGIHGGGTPAKAFSKLTDFYYLRLAQTRFAESEEMASSASPWGKLRVFAARQPGVIAMTTLGSLVLLCFLLPALFRA